MTDKNSDQSKVKIETSDEIDNPKKKPAITQTQVEGEIGGPSGLEPTRYGDWERKGIVSDF